MADSDSNTIRLTRTRLAAGVLVIVLLASGASYAAAQAASEGGPPPPYYGDVPEQDAYVPEAMVGSGCMTAYPNRRFRPSLPVDRLQLARTVYACGPRSSFSEDADTITETELSVADAQVISGSRNPHGGGTYSLIASIELNAIEHPSTPCTVRFRLFDGVTEEVREELYVDIPTQGPRPSVRLNASMVDGGVIDNHEPDRALSRYFFLRAQLQGPCPVQVNSEVGMVAMISPFDSRGTGAEDLHVYHP